MRIISGKYKSSKILFPSKDITRPLRDRVRQSLFNILEHSNNFNFNFKNSVIIDCFCGSGSFGIESLSRGAKKIYFIDKNKEPINLLKANLKKLNIKKNNYEIFNLDLPKNFTDMEVEKINPDLIFLDPPFKIEIIEKIFFFFKKKDINSLIIFHCFSKKELELKNFIILENRIYGVSRIIIGKIV